MRILRETTHRLAAVYPEGEAAALARWVMEERFGLSLTDIMLDKDNDLSSFEQQELQNITERLLQKEPIQYILGHTTFCGLNINVAPGVLIPRPETQELVEWIVGDYPPAKRTQTHVLDIGTGSGCIALALAHQAFRVEAWDVSHEALQIAQKNAQAMKFDVLFRQKDILQEVLLEGKQEASRSYDIIVSNPPYICQQEAKDMDNNVLEHEPHLALFVPDNDPLLFYRNIARFATMHLSAGGRLYFEINRAYGTEICQMLSKLGFEDITLRNDQFDNPRMVRATFIY